GGRAAHCLLHVLAVRLLPLRRRPRHPPGRAALLPRPERGLRLRTGPYGALSRLPRARRAAGRAEILRLPVRLHPRRDRRQRMARLAVLRLGRGRRTAAHAPPDGARLRREPAPPCPRRVGAPPCGAARPTPPPPRGGVG